MAIHVIEAALRIVLDDKYAGLFPEAALADSFHNPAEGEIVVCDHGARCGKFRGRPLRVVAGKAHEQEIGHLAFLLELLQILQEKISPIERQA